MGILGFLEYIFEKTPGKCKFLCELVALRSFFILGFALLNKELLHFGIGTGQWQTGCLAGVEGGAFCCVTLLKILSACPAPKRLLQVDEMGMVLVLD